MEVERTQKRKLAKKASVEPSKPPVTVVAPLAHQVDGLFFDPSRSPDEDAQVWMSGHPSYASQLPLTNTPEFKVFLHQYWPATESYFNPLNAVFSAQVLSLNTLRSRPVWFFRDGLVPLMWFFKTFASPKGVDSKLIVPLKFANVVPKAWHSNVKYYEAVQTQNSLTDIATIYVVGVIGNLQLDLDLLRARLAQARAILGDRLQSCEKLFYLPSRHGDLRDQGIQFEAYRIIFSELGFNGRPIDWAECTSTRHNTKSAVLSTLSDFVIADEFVTHAAAAKGSFQFHLRSVPTPFDIQIPLSPYHGFNVYESVEQAISMGAPAPISRIEIMKVIGHPIYLAMPWPQIFQGWN